MNYSEHDIQAVLEEKDSERLQLSCPKHRYLGGKLPPETKGCKDCWMAYYVWDLATTPPSLRQERLDELESVVRHAVEYEQKGRFGKDFTLYEPTDPRFEIKIEKDAE